MVVAIKKNYDFYEYFADVMSNDYSGLHMHALSVDSHVIKHIPEKDITCDLALKAVSGWGYAYR